VGSQRDLPRCPIKEAKPQLALQFANQYTQSRGSDEQGPRGPREASWTAQDGRTPPSRWRTMLLSPGRPLLRRRPGDSRQSSYGGVVITEAGNDPKISGLVYIAAFAPEKDESVETLIQNSPAGHRCLRSCRRRMDFCSSTDRSWRLPSLRTSILNWPPS
jgi:hypothetical protein